MFAHRLVHTKLTSKTLPSPISPLPLHPCAVSMLTSPCKREKLYVFTILVPSYKFFFSSTWLYSETLRQPKSSPPNVWLTRHRRQGFANSANTILLRRYNTNTANSTIPSYRRDTRTPNATNANQLVKTPNPSTLGSTFEVHELTTKHDGMIFKPECFPEFKKYQPIGKGK